MTPPKTLFALLATVVLAFAQSSAAVAQDTILTVLSQSDGVTGEVNYTLEDLDALPQVEIRTINEFVDGPTRFEGPLARVILKQTSDINATKVSLIAANDYEIEVPIADFRKYDVILATRQEGKLLSRRDKGPIWVIYPMSDHSELRDSVYNSRLIWQLVRMEVLKN